MAFLLARIASKKSVLSQLGRRVKQFKMWTGGGALQLADQFTYDNNFIYFQPGNGKVKIKEPKDQIKIASKKLGDLIGSN